MVLIEWQTIPVCHKHLSKYCWFFRSNCYVIIQQNLLREYLGNHCIGFLRGQYQRIPIPGVLEPCHQGFVSILCSGKARLSSHSEQQNNNLTKWHHDTKFCLNAYSKTSLLWLSFPFQYFLTNQVFNNYCGLMPEVQIIGSAVVI